MRKRGRTNQAPGASAPEALADPDGRFVELEGIEVHYKVFGEGEPSVILLHGFGASVFSWRLAMEPLAMDLAVAVLAAEEYPDRVRGLVLVAPAVYSSGPPSWTQPLLRLLQLRHLGPLLARRLVGTLESILDRSWHDPGLITAEVREGYRLPLKVDGWDRGLWELMLADRVADLPARLGRQPPGGRCHPWCRVPGDPCVRSSAPGREA